MQYACETSFKLFPCPAEGWWLNSPEGLCLRHFGCYHRALEISSHPTEQFICWKEVESAFCPAPPGSARVSLWEMSLCTRRPRERLSPRCGLPALPGVHRLPKKKLLQNLRSPFQHSLFPAASISQAKMGWGGRVRYCKLFPPAMTVYIWLLSNSRVYSETKV